MFASTGEGNVRKGREKKLELREYLLAGLNPRRKKKGGRTERSNTLKRKRKKNKENSPAGLMRGRTRVRVIKREYVGNIRGVLRKSMGKRNAERGGKSENAYKVKQE